MLTQIVDGTKKKVMATLLAAASLFPSSSNETTAAQRDSTTGTAAAPRSPSHSGEKELELPFLDLEVLKPPHEVLGSREEAVRILGTDNPRVQEATLHSAIRWQPYGREYITTESDLPYLPRHIVRGAIKETIRARYDSPHYREGEGALVLRLEDGTLKGMYMWRLHPDSASKIREQRREYHKWQEQAEQREEKMQNPFTRDKWTLGENSQEGVRFITTTVNGKFVRLQRISDDKDGWFKLDPDEAKLISDFYREQAKKTFAATGDLQLAVVMLPQVQQELSKRLDGAALESQPGDSVQPQTVEELLQEKLPEGVVVATTLVTDDLDKISSHLQEVFDGSWQKNDQPLYPVTISDPSELRILKAHFEKLLESLRKAQEGESLSMLKLTAPPPENWAHPGSMAT